MKVFLINDSSSNSNWGDRAAATALKQMIVECGGKIHGIITEDDLRYSRLFHKTTPAPEQIHQNHRIKDLIRMFLPPIMFELRKGLQRLYQNNKSGNSVYIPQTVNDFDSCAGLFLQREHSGTDCLDLIESSDVIVIHGDGCMVGNGIIPRTILFLGYLIKQYLNKKVVIVNHTTEFDHPDLYQMARKVYPLFDDVVFRDTFSVDHCNSLCRGRYCADTAFLFKPALRSEWEVISSRAGYFDVWPDTARFDPSKAYICMGGSSLFYCEGDSTHIINKYAELVKRVQKTFAGQIVLTSSDIVDQGIMRSIAQLLELPLVGLQIPVQQAVDIVGNAEAYIGGRWHPSIFALRGGTPVIPLSSKTFKMQALVQMAGLDFNASDALSLENEYDVIVDRLLSCLKQGNSLRMKLKQWAENEAEACWGNVDCLKHRSI
ncbi:polysaccharide pyruvyl transferase family protein [Geobacter anodireducens]